MAETHEPGRADQQFERQREDRQDHDLGREFEVEARRRQRKREQQQRQRRSERRGQAAGGGACPVSPA